MKIVKKIMAIFTISILVFSTACGSGSPETTIRIIKQRSTSTIDVDSTYEMKDYSKDFVGDECIVTIKFIKIKKEK